MSYTDAIVGSSIDGAKTSESTCTISVRVKMRSVRLK